MRDLNRYVAAVCIIFAGIFVGSHLMRKEGSDLGETASSDRVPAADDVVETNPVPGQEEVDDPYFENTRLGGDLLPGENGDAKEVDKTPLTSRSPMPTDSRNRQALLQDRDEERKGEEVQYIMVEGTLALGTDPPKIFLFKNLDTPKKRNDVLRRWEASEAEYFELQPIAADLDDVFRMEMGKPLSSQGSYEIASRHLAPDESTVPHPINRPDFTGITLTFQITAELDCSITCYNWHWPGPSQTHFFVRRLDEQQTVLWQETFPPHREIFLTFTPVSAAELRNSLGD